MARVQVLTHVLPAERGGGFERQALVPFFSWPGLLWRALLLPVGHPFKSLWPRGSEVFWHQLY